MFRHLNPWYMEEAKSAAPKFGDPWEDHAKVKNSDHHGRQADLHGEAEDYHAHAVDTLADYLHNPYKSASGSDMAATARAKQHDTVKAMLRGHRASAAFHNSMYHKHSKASEEALPRIGWIGLGKDPLRSKHGIRK